MKTQYEDQLYSVEKMYGEMQKKYEASSSQSKCWLTTFVVISVAACIVGAHCYGIRI